MFMRDVSFGTTPIYIIKGSIHQKGNATVLFFKPRPAAFQVSVFNLAAPSAPEKVQRSSSMRITVRTPAKFQKPDLSPEERERDAETRRIVRQQISEQTGQPYCSYFQDEDDPDCPYVVETLDQKPTQFRLSDGTIYKCASAEPNPAWVAFVRKAFELAEVARKREA